MDNTTYQMTVLTALQELYRKTIGYVPNLVAAIIVVIIGWLIGIFLSKAVQKLLEMIRIDQLADSLGMKTLSSRVGRDLSLSKFGGWLVKWFFFLGSFFAAAEILGLKQISNFLYTDVLSYAGNVVMAMAILLLGMLAADFFSGLVSSVVRASGLRTASALGAITRWAIVIFSVIAALAQLRIATSFLQDLFRAIVAMLAIAGGIAFGLGGKDHARKVLENIEEDLTRKM